MFEGFTHHRIDTGGPEGVVIDCVAAGAGAPVLLLHGYPQTRALWARIAPLLVARGYRVVCADLRGYGASSKPAASADLANYSFRAMAADQVAVMAALGHDRFHMVGHDRGARTGYRMALDHPGRVASLTIMDIVPTAVLFSDPRPEVAAGYWHWYFLAQPAPLPETLIAGKEDAFFETSIAGWGAGGLSAFDPDQLAAYRQSWHDPAAVAGACNDYRAALRVDLPLDRAEGERRIATPTLVLYGDAGLMARLYDIPALWQARCGDMEAAAMPGGHFFPDLCPDAVADRVADFLGRHPA